MDAKFGAFQAHTSPRMNKYPFLSKLLTKVFGYTNIGNYARSLVFRKIIKRVPMDEVKEVLDLGCGYGSYSIMMARSFPHAQITGLELQQFKVDLLEKVSREENIPNLHGHHGLIDTIPAEKKFDFIFSVDVFEHILEPEMPFAQAYEKLNDGGYLLVKMPSEHQHIIAPERWFGEHKVWLDEEHIGQVYELEDLKARFKKEGFEVVFATYSDGWWSRLGWELGYFTKKMGPIFQLLSLPLAKLFVKVDNLKDVRTKGNTIQVIGRKLAR